jgi:predicted phage tail protein
MSFTTRLRRGVLVAAVATTALVGVAGITRADTAITAPAATAADGALAAVVSPTAPRSVTAAPRNSRVKLAWLAPSSNGGATIDKYQVQRARAGGRWRTIAYPTTRRYTAAGLTNGVRYSFRVRAHNRTGWGPYSKIVNTVPRTVPTAPRTPTVTPGNKTVTLAWQRPASNGGATIDKYRVQRATSTGGPWTTIATPTTRSHTAGGLANGTRYYFRVRAHNPAGWGPWSTIVNAVPRTVPSAPQSLLADDEHDGLVHLAWVRASDRGAVIHYYQVARSTDQVNWTSMPTTKSTYLNADGLTNGETYYFRVRAHNAAGWGPWSSIVSAVPHTVPSAPVGLWWHHNKILSTIELFWSPPADDGGAAVDHYLLELSDDPNLPNSWAPWTTTSEAHYTSALYPYVVYWRVRAYNDAGYSPASNVITISVP